MECQWHFKQCKRFTNIAKRKPSQYRHGGSTLIISNKIMYTLFLPSISHNLQIIATSLFIKSIPITIASTYLTHG